MIVYVNGDSHSAAAEAVHWACFAQDDNQYKHLGRRAHPENLAVSYGQHIADYLDARLVCEAESASSNSRIIRTTWEQIQGVQGWPVVKPDLIIIGWSTWEREEWSYEGNTYQVTASGTDHVPNGLKARYKTWVIEQDEHTRDRKLIESHKKIWEFHRHLLALDIPHLFFNTYSTFQPIRLGHLKRDLVNPGMYDWDKCYIEPYDQNYAFYYWCLNNGFKTVNPNSYHFGADAHQAWANFLIQNYTQKLLTQ